MDEERDEQPIEPGEVLEGIARALGLEPVPPPSEELLAEQHRALAAREMSTARLIRMLNRHDDSTLVSMVEWALALVAYRNRCMPEDINVAGPDSIREWRQSQDSIERFLGGQPFPCDCEICSG